MDPDIVEASLARVAQDLSEKGVDFSTPAAAEAALRRLQTESGDFHRLPLIRELMQRLEAALRLQLPKKLNEQVAGTGGDVVEGTAVQVANRLVNTAQVQAAQLRLVGEVQSCVDILQQREQPLDMGAAWGLGADGAGADVMAMDDFPLSDSSDGSSAGSGGGRGGYGMDRMSKRVVATLEALGSPQEATARGAVAVIADRQVTADMIAESAKWEKAIGALGAALGSGFPAVRAAALSLLEGVAGQVEDCPPQVADVFLAVASRCAAVSPGLSLSDSFAAQVPDESLRLLQLALGLLWDLPSCWVLYPAGVLRRIADAASLLLVGYSVAPGADERETVSIGDGTVCAFHALAVLDPDMGWFRRWMGTARMGALLPASMVESGAIHHMLYLCMHVLQAQAEKASITKPAMELPSPSNQGPPVISLAGQAAANVLGSLIACASGRALFPLKLGKKMKASMRGRKKEMNAGAIQSLIRLLVPKAYPCPQPVTEAAFQQLLALAGRQSPAGSILTAHHVEALLEPLQAVLKEAGAALPPSLRRVSGAFAGVDADSIATHRMVGAVLMTLAKLPCGRSVILGTRVAVKASPAGQAEPSYDASADQLAGKFSVVGAERCALFQLVAALARVCMINDPGASKVPPDLLAAYLEVVGEIATDSGAFWELMESGLVPTLCQAVSQNSPPARRAKSDKDRGAERTRAGAVAMCASALCRVATTPMGAQLVWRCGAIWATASHLVSKYTAATSTPEQRAEMLKHASGIALVAEGREALVSNGLPRILWLEVTRELLGREDLGLLLQSDASAYPMLSSLRDLQGILAWHGSVQALLNEPMKIPSVRDNQKVFKALVDGVLDGNDTYGNPHSDDVKQLTLQLLCMFRLDTNGLALLTSGTRIHEILTQVISSQPRELKPQIAAGNGNAKKGNKGGQKHGKAGKKAPQSRPAAGSDAGAGTPVPCPAPNERWVLSSIVDMNTASAHALLEAHHAVGGEEERYLVPYPCHIKAATWYQEHPEVSKGSAAKLLPSPSQRRERQSRSEVEELLRSGPPAMEEATNWWRGMQVKLLDDMAAEVLSFPSVGLLLQRTVMVAMNGKHPENHHFFMIGCSTRTPWKPIRDIGASSADAGPSKDEPAEVTLHPAAERCILRAAVYFERIASIHLVDAGKRGWDAEGLVELQKWAFMARHNCSTDPPPGFDRQMRLADWFVSVIWSIMGSGQISEEFLVYLSRSPSAAYVWPAWGESVAGSLPAMLVCHLVETIAAEQMPGLAGAFAAASVSMSHIILRWLSQEFVNYLSWEDVVQFVCLVLVMGPDYIVYYMIALLRHLETSARRHAASADLIPWILQSQLGSFSLPPYLDYIQNLETEYKAYVLPAMMINDVMRASDD